MFLNHKKDKIWLGFAARSPIGWIYKNFELKLKCGCMKDGKKFGDSLFCGCWEMSKNEENFDRHERFCWLKDELILPEHKVQSSSHDKD